VVFRILLLDVISLGLDHWKNKTLQANICRLGFGSTIYMWRNSNEIKHAGHPRIEDQILQQIHYEVRAKLWTKC
jgi:hypothetical protein